MPLIHAVRAWVSRQLGLTIGLLATAVMATAITINIAAAGPGGEPPPRAPAIDHAPPPSGPQRLCPNGSAEPGS